MSNMSYCRFRNTLSDLGDCQDALADVKSEELEGDTEEKIAMIKLIRMCKEIHEEYGHLDDSFEALGWV